MDNVIDLKSGELFKSAETKAPVESPMRFWNDGPVIREDIPVRLGEHVLPKPGEAGLFSTFYNIVSTIPDTQSCIVYNWYYSDGTIIARKLGVVLFEYNCESGLFPSFWRQLV